jgi:hypothetical protein
MTTLIAMGLGWTALAYLLGLLVQHETTKSSARRQREINERLAYWEMVMRQRHEAFLPLSEESREILRANNPDALRSIERERMNYLKSTN